MSANWKQDVNFIKVYSKKRQISIVIKNVNNSENN